MQPSLQRAFVLNAWPYRETSVLAELFTRESGRVGVVVRGARQSQSPKRALLQPGVPLLLNWGGKGELGYVKTIEPEGMPMRFARQMLTALFYMNELLMRTVHRHDPHESLFDAYYVALRQLENGVLEPALRVFEKHLLQEVGYGLHITCDAGTGLPIQAEQYYRFVEGHGCVHCDGAADASGFLGAHLMAIAEDDYRDAAVLSSAKRLLRLALQPLLGDKPLHSRRLWVG